MDGRRAAFLRFDPMMLSQWKCRCGYDRYHRISVQRKTGARYETPFCPCSRCSMMFLNAAQFERQQHREPERRGAAGGGHADAAEAASQLVTSLDRTA